MSKHLNGQEIAVIGLSGKFPGANNIKEFWNNLIVGKESITFFSPEEMEESGVDPDSFNNANYVNAKGYLENSEQFDDAFFNYSLREVELMDPQVRVFHECVWHALEDAGYSAATYSGLIGLYGGASGNLYWEAVSSISDNSQLLGQFSANQLMNKDFMCSQIAHRLNLKGPVVSINTACSTSLVTVHMASQSLLNGECDIALAGGVSISLPIKSGYLYQEGMVVSPDGHCRAFDENGKGTVPGNGVGIVVLKRYEEAVADNDNIYAVIKASAINNDGNRKSGFTAPSIDGQVEVIQTALNMAEIDAESIQYVEAHGTGTILGDPIEMEALKIAFNTSQKGYCRIGSVKSNIGHLDVAAGIAGLIKTVLAIKHRKFPPTLNYDKINPKINLEDSPFVINNTLLDCSQSKDILYAGVSSFGIGGTNAHLILEEAPGFKETTTGRNENLITISAQTETALDQYCLDLANYIKQNDSVDPADFAFTLLTGRTSLDYRRFFIASSRDELNQLLHASIDNKSQQSRKVFNSQVDHTDKPIVFMFPGLGNQYIKMGLGLYQREAVFKEELDRCFSFLDNQLDFSIKDILYPSENLQEAQNEIKQIDISQIIVFIFEYALGRFLIHLGLKPSIMIGYSFGEFTAACLAGVFSMEDALCVIIQRGILIKETSKGAMLSVPLQEKELRDILPDSLDIAIINGPSCIVSGPVEVVEDFEKSLKSAKHICMRLEAYYGIHSHLMQPIVEKFTKVMETISLNPPEIAFISNMSGYWITEEEAMDPAYWAKQLTQTVCFSKGINEILNEDALTLIEVGPDRSLSALLRNFVNRDSQHSIFNIIRNPQENVSDTYYLLTRLGQFWASGYIIDWKQLYNNEIRHRLALPVYPFERQNFHLRENPFSILQDKRNNKKLLSKKADMANWFYVQLWQQSVLLSDKQKFIAGLSWLIFANRDKVGAKLVEELKGQKQKVITVFHGDKFSQLSSNEFEINIVNTADYIRLFKIFSNENQQFDKIIHLWSMPANSSDRSENNIPINREDNFYSLLNIIQTSRSYKIYNRLQLGLIIPQVFSITGEEALYPEYSLLYGLGLVVPQEYPDIDCFTLDLEIPETENEQTCTEISSQILEFFLCQQSESLISYRNNIRWKPLYQPVKLKKELIQENLFKKNGVYVITGGAGKIGWIISEYLAQTYQAKVIIIQRSFPVKSEWDRWLKSNHEDNTISIMINNMQKLEQEGAQFEIYQSDITNEKRMKVIFTSIDQHHQMINGVIHCAGNMGDHFFNTIDNLDKTQCQVIFAPKIEGVMILERILENRKLDFCLLMSSTASILGGIGFAAYAAANIFMDAFTAKHNKYSDQKWTIVNWESWYGKYEERLISNSSIGELKMSPEEGLDAFQRVISTKKFLQIIHSPGDLEVRLEQWTKFNNDTRDTGHSIKKKIKKRLSPQSIANFEKPSNEIEKQITQIWENFLGIENIGIHDNFFELGATSLTLIRIKTLIEEELTVTIPIVDMFAFPTISLLTKKLNQTNEVNNSTMSEKRLDELVSGRANLTRQLKLRKSMDKS